MMDLSPWWIKDRACVACRVLETLAVVADHGGVSSFRYSMLDALLLACIHHQPQLLLSPAVTIKLHVFCDVSITPVTIRRRRRADGWCIGPHAAHNLHHSPPQKVLAQGSAPYPTPTVFRPLSSLTTSFANINPAQRSSAVQFAAPTCSIQPPTTRLRPHTTSPLSLHAHTDSRTRRVGWAQGHGVTPRFAPSSSFFL